MTFLEGVAAEFESAHVVPLKDPLFYSDQPPPTPAEGQLWFNWVTGKYFMWVGSDWRVIQNAF